MQENFFKEAQFSNKQKSVSPTSCKDKSGNILSEHGDILQRCRQYFCDLQTISSGTQELISEKVILSNSEEVPPPTYYEVNQVIEKLKIHEAAGLDNIPAELIKQVGTELKNRIHKLIMKIWDEERLPTEWMEGIICPIYKKGNRMIGSNCRPITPLNVVYKIFSILINNRLTKTVFLLSVLQLFVSFGLLNYFFPLLPLLRPLFPIGQPHLPQIIPHIQKSNSQLLAPVSHVFRYKILKHIHRH